jgi:hypothetical protein
MCVKTVIALEVFCFEYFANLPQNIEKARLKILCFEYFGAFSLRMPASGPDCPRLKQLAPLGHLGSPWRKQPL